MTRDLPSSHPPLGTRLAIATAVGLISYFGWLIVWVLGAVGQGITRLFSRTAEVSFIEHFGDYWQWILAGSAALLIIASLAASRHLLAVGIAWFVSLVVLTLVGLFAFGPPDQAWAVILPIGLAAALLFGLQRLTSVRPNQRLKLPAHVD